MKKTFLARRNALLSPRGLQMGIFALLVALLIVAARLIAPGAFITGVAPVWTFSTRASSALGAWTTGFTNARTLAAERDQLATENGTLVLENRTLVEKLRDLEKLLGSEASSPPSVLAGVLIRPPEAAYDTLIIGAGSEDGLSPGMTAFADGVPIGLVASATAHAARLTLFSASGVALSGWAGSTRVAITIRGEGGGAMSASVPQGAKVAVGDAVFAPGPGALPIGTVAKIESNPSSPSATLRIASAVNLFSVTWVVVRDLGGKP